MLNNPMEQNQSNLDRCIYFEIFELPDGPSFDQHHHFVILSSQSHETYYRFPEPVHNAKKIEQVIDESKFSIEKITAKKLRRKIEQNKLTMRYKEEVARAAGMAMEVILSRGPFKYVCLWMLWNNFCFSKRSSLDLKGVSDILHHQVVKTPKRLLTKYVLVSACTSHL